MSFEIFEEVEKTMDTRITELLEEIKKAIDKAATTGDKYQFGEVDPPQITDASTLEIQHAHIPPIWGLSIAWGSRWKTGSWPLSFRRNRP